MLINNINSSVRIIRNILVLNGKYIVISPLLLMGGVVSALFTNDQFTAYQMILGGFLPVMVLMYSVWRDMDNADLFTLTLPVSRSEYVVAQFLVYWMIMFYGYVVISLISWAITGFSHNSAAFLASFRFNTVLTIAELISLLGIVLFPLVTVFRKKALLLMMFIVFGLATFLLVLGIVLLQRWELVGSAWHLVFQAVHHLQVNNTHAAGILLSLLVIIAANLLSLRICQRLFSRINF